MISRERNNQYIMLCFLGVTFTEKWNTDNILTTEVAVADSFCQGAKVSVDTSFAPQTGYDFLIILSVLAINLFIQTVRIVHLVLIYTYLIREHMFSEG